MLRKDVSMDDIGEATTNDPEASHLVLSTSTIAAGGRVVTKVDGELLGTT